MLLLAFCVVIDNFMEQVSFLGEPSKVAVHLTYQQKNCQYKHLWVFAHPVVQHWPLSVTVFKVAPILYLPLGDSHTSVGFTTFVQLSSQKSYL